MAASLLEALVDKNFDRWELFCLQKIFAIPPEVQLPLIPGLPLLQNIPNVSEQQNETVENDLVFYRQQLQSIRLWKQSLAEKLFKLDERRKELESQVAALRFLQQAADKDDGSTINDQIELVCKLAADLRASQLGARQFEGPIEVLHQRFQFHRQSKNQQRQSTRQQTVSSALIEDQLHERYCESMEPIMQLLQDME